MSLEASQVVTKALLVELQIENTRVLSKVSEGTTKRKEDDDTESAPNTVPRIVGTE